MDSKNHKHIEKHELLEKAKVNIENFGLQVIMVNSESYNPSFAYSVGLTETLNHPEIICFGLPSDLGHSIINVHDHDGDWQFLTGDQMPEDIKIVALEQLVLRDKTLNDVFDSRYGEAADRDSIDGKWRRTKVEHAEGE